jgi:hypothetical protein
VAEGSELDGKEDEGGISVPEIGVVPQAPRRSRLVNAKPVKTRLNRSRLCGIQLILLSDPVDTRTAETPPPASGAE